MQPCFCSSAADYQWLNSLFHTQENHACFSEWQVANKFSYCFILILAVGVCLVFSFSPLFGLVLPVQNSLQPSSESVIHTVYLLVYQNMTECNTVSVCQRVTDSSLQSVVAFTDLSITFWQPFLQECRPLRTYAKRFRSWTALLGSASVMPDDALRLLWRV